MPPKEPSSDDTIRSNLMALSNAVREMTAAGAKPIPATPDHFNLLAWPWHNNCRICGLPGHKCDSVKSAALCYTAILSLIGFWEDILSTVSSLYQMSDRFQKAVSENKPTYRMRLSDEPMNGGNIETVLVDQLTRNYLKFQAHFARIRPKAAVILQDQDTARYQQLTETLNGFFLHGLTLTDLFERSITQ